MVTNVPLELRFVDQWVCWKLEDRDGKPTKIPIDAKTLRCADVSNSATYSTFIQAVETFQNRNLSGVGFVLTKNDPFVGIDQDHCISNGIIRPESQEILSTLNSYTEISPSHLGLHTWCIGKLPDGDRKKDFLEMYDWGRYLTFTGDILDGKQLPIRECTKELNEIHRRFIARDSSDEYLIVGSRHDWIRTRALNQTKIGVPFHEIMEWGVKVAERNGLHSRMGEIEKLIEWAYYKSNIARGIAGSFYQSEQEGIIRTLSSANQWVTPEIEWLIPGLLPKKRLILCGADSQTGKSKLFKK